MTTEQKTKVLAELDGYSEVSDNGTAYVKDTVENWEKHRHDCIVSEEREGMLFVDVPRYLTSYDAILPLIQKQLKTYGDELRFQAAIYELLVANPPRGEDNPYCIAVRMLCATPVQLADALLRATGKWKE